MSQVNWNQSHRATDDAERPWGTLQSIE